MAEHGAFLNHLRHEHPRLDLGGTGIQNSGMTFTKDERDIIEQAGSFAVTIDGIPCVVLRADLYDQVRALLSTGLSHDELRAMLARSAQNSDWLDSSMDIYDDYDLSHPR